MAALATIMALQIKELEQAISEFVSGTSKELNLPKKKFVPLRT